MPVRRLPLADPALPDGEHVAIGSDPWHTRVLCRCGAVLLADHERRAWVATGHGLPFDGGDMVAHDDPEPDDRDEEDESPEEVKSDTVRAVMEALGIESETE